MINEVQNGFRSERSCVEHIFNKHTTQQTPIYIIKIALLHSLISERPMIQLIEIFYGRNYTVLDCLTI